MREVTLHFADGPFTIQRSGHQWIWQDPRTFEPVLRTPVQELLGALLSIRADTILTSNSRDYKRYGVDEGQGLRLQLGNPEQPHEDWWFGRIDTLPDRLFVRLTGEKEVYGAPAGGAARIWAPAAAYFSEKFLPVSLVAVQDIQWTRGDSIQFYRKLGEAWTAGIKEATSVDVSAYLRQWEELEAPRYLQAIVSDGPDTELIFREGPDRTPLRIHLRALPGGQPVVRSSAFPKRWYLLPTDFQQWPE